MKPLAEVLGEHVFTLSGRCACGWQMLSRGLMLKAGRHPRDEVAAHLAAVVADWLTSDEAAEVMASAFSMPHKRVKQTYAEYDRRRLRSALAALAAHAKGATDD